MKNKQKVSVTLPSSIDWEFIDEMVKQRKYKSRSHYFRELHAMYISIHKVDYMNWLIARDKDEGGFE